MEFRDLGIPPLSTLTLRPPRIKIFVKAPLAGVLAVLVRPDEAIGALKVELETRLFDPLTEVSLPSNEAIPSLSPVRKTNKGERGINAMGFPEMLKDDMQFFLRARLLNDARSFEHEGVGAGSVLDLVPKMKPVRATVQMPSGDLVSLELHPTNDTLQNAMDKLQNAHGSPLLDHHRLAMGDEVLEPDGRPIKDYGIPDDTVLVLVANASVFVEATGHVNKFKVDLERTTVYELARRVQEVVVEAAEWKEVRLKHRGSVLRAEQKLGQAGVTDQGRLELLPPSRRIFVDTDEMVKPHLFLPIAAYRHSCHRIVACARVNI